MMTPVGPYRSPHEPIRRVDTPMRDIDLTTHGLTGWPREGRCPRCGGLAVSLSSTIYNASYECRGRNGDYTGSPPNGYCGTFEVDA